MNKKKEIKVNLGSGEYKKKDYINVDWNKDDKPDVIHDLNSLPYPFEESSVDLIEADHVLEHLDKPLEIMKELHRILKPGGKLKIKVPHFSRGFTHAEHRHGFDVTFPLYFKKEFKTSSYYGGDFDLEKMELHWMAFFHLLPFMGVGKVVISILKVLNAVISFFANLSTSFCSRVWCYWVGGFEEIEFVFVCKK